MHGGGWGAMLVEWAAIAGGQAGSRTGNGPAAAIHADHGSARRLVSMLTFLPYRYTAWLVRMKSLAWRTTCHSAVLVPSLHTNNAWDATSAASRATSPCTAARRSPRNAALRWPAPAESAWVRRNADRPPFGHQ